MSIPVIRRTLAQDERLDVIARDMLSREDRGNLEALLKANPGLAAGGPFAAGGRRLAVPAAPVASPVLPSINPWE